MNTTSPLGVGYMPSQHDKQGKQSKDPPLTHTSHGNEFLDLGSDKMKIDKSNILLLGPTGSGNFVVVHLTTLLGVRTQTYSKFTYKLSNEITRN